MKQRDRASGLTVPSLHNVAAHKNFFKSQLVKTAIDAVKGSITEQGGTLKVTKEPTILSTEVPALLALSLPNSLLLLLLLIQFVN